jgi:hypothetical protein
VVQKWMFLLLPKWPPFLNCICHYHIPQIENLLNIELKLEIPNIMLCVSLKSIGQQIKILERLQHISDGRPTFPYPPLHFAGAGNKSDKCNLKMVAILAAIFNTCMVAKTHNKFRSAPMLQLQRKLIFRRF